VRNIGYFVKLFTRWESVSLSVSLLLFLAAGSTQLSSLRYYLVTFSTFLLATMFSIDPDLSEERSRSLEQATTPDRFSAALSFLATLMLAALDIGRLHRFDSVSGNVRTGSLLLFAAATTLQLWAMVVNPFFSPEIRLQSERGHQLIACGPYRFMRHPGYLAMLLSVPASALAIGSWLALVPAAAFCLVILKRVRTEEEFLRKNLPGYGVYMRQVRGRLFPWIAIRPRPQRLSVATKFERAGSNRRRP
jgi:protein-S-isoprenylcysteine O-methyltransferase Ste14